MSDRLAIAKEAWSEVPDWVELLVAACDRDGSSQGKVAKELGCTASVVSQVLHNQYKGAMGNIEERVRAVFAAHQVKCPALQWISSADCLRWRDEAAKLTSSDPITVRMFRACQGCSVFKGEDEQ